MTLHQRGLGRKVRHIGRLVQLLSLLGSEDPNVRALAGAEANALVASAGWSWPEILFSWFEEQPRMAVGHRGVARLCLLRDDLMFNDHELDFLRYCAEACCLSEKQTAWLKRLARRANITWVQLHD